MYIISSIMYIISYVVFHVVSGMYIIRVTCDMRHLLLYTVYGKCDTA